MRILLITYDNGSLFHGFPMGLGYIARVLVDRGYDVDVWSQDIHHYPDKAAAIEQAERLYAGDTSFRGFR